MKSFNEFLTETWMTTNVSDRIWDKVVEWVSLQYEFTIKPHAFRTKKEYQEATNKHPLLGDENSFSLKKTTKYGGNYVLVPRFVVAWDPLNLTYRIPLDLVLKDSPDLIDAITFNPIANHRTEKYLNLIFRFDHVQNSSMANLGDKGGGDKLITLIDMGVLKTDLEMEEVPLLRREGVLSILTGSSDPGPFIWKPRDINNIRSPLLKSVFSHEFTHYMDLKRMFANIGISKTIKLTDKEFEKRKESQTARDTKQRYYNSPTEINAHSSEILNHISRYPGILNQLETPEDFRRFFIHMMNSTSDDNEKQRWIQYNHFIKNMKPHHLKKFLRRTRQYKSGFRPVNVHSYVRGTNLVRSYTRAKPSVQLGLPIKEEKNVE